jgi:adenine phosphoribosyltransferase
LATPPENPACSNFKLLKTNPSAYIAPAMRTNVTAKELAAAIRTIPDFPQPGIQFKDITPVLADPRLFAGSIELLTEHFSAGSVDAVVGVDARGFIFAAAAALRLKSGFVPVRKKGKLPFKTHELSYELEYGSNTVAIHIDAVRPGSRVILIDDLLATGGTAAAAATLLGKIGAEILEISFLIELEFLKGREKLKKWPVRSLVTF